MGFPEVMTTVGGLFVQAQALAAIGAGAAAGTGAMAPGIAEAMDEVLVAAGVDLSTLPDAQRGMLAAFVRSAFGQAADIYRDPTRPPGWSHTDPDVLEGQGRASMPMPDLLAKTGEFGDVTSFLDVGTGVGLLAVAATRVWPGVSVVGIDPWEPALERARSNVAQAGLGDRIELRAQSIVELDDRDRFDLSWVPTFFLSPDVLVAGLARILAATRPGGRVAVALFDIPPDPLASATMRLRVLRDGGSLPEPDAMVRMLEEVGWSDPHVVPKTGPITLTFVAGTKA